MINRFASLSIAALGFAISITPVLAEPTQGPQAGQQQSGQQGAQQQQGQQQGQQQAGQKQRKQKPLTTQQQVDQSVQSGTVPSKYRSSVPKQYQQYVPFGR
jgi:hypothetical protein